MKCCERKWTLGIIGTALLVFAASLYPLIDSVQLSELEKSNIMKDGALLYDNLISPTPTVYFQYFMWNLTNPDEFEAGEKPFYVQKGPYSYIEIYTKYNLTQEFGDFESSSWISYTQDKKYYWDQESSCATCSPDDVVSNINIAATAVYGIVNNVIRKPRFADTLVDICCQRNDGFCQIKPSFIIDTPVASCLGQDKSYNVPLGDYMMEEVNKVLIAANAKLTDNTKTVNELLFGFEDPVFRELGEKLRQNGGLLSESVWKPLGETLANLEYGFFKAVNESEYGVDKYQVVNGNGNSCVDGKSSCALRTTEILSWNDKTDLSPWYGDDKVNYCNRIQGTDGLTTFSNPQKDDVINFFVSDLCKTVWMVYGGSDTYKGPTGESKYHIPVMQFYGPPDVFYSKSNVKNQCFCSPNLPNGWCTDKDGIQMIDQCQFGAPAVISGPHFASASEYFFDTVGGMNPVDPPKFSMEEGEHTSFSAYDPISGAIVYNSKKVQINFLVTPDERIEMLSSVAQPLVLPIFWTNETMKLDEATTKLVYEASVKPMKIAKSLQYTLFAIGGLLLLLSIVDFIHGWRNEKNKTENFEKSEEKAEKAEERKQSVELVETYSKHEEDSPQPETEPEAVI